MSRFNARWVLLSLWLATFMFCFVTVSFWASDKFEQNDVDLTSGIEKTVGLFSPFIALMLAHVFSSRKSTAAYGSMKSPQALLATCLSVFWLGILATQYYRLGAVKSVEPTALFASLGAIAPWASLVVGAAIGFYFGKSGQDQP